MGGSSLSGGKRGPLDVVVDSGRGPTYGVWVDLLLVVGGGPLDVVRHL